MHTYNHVHVYVYKLYSSHTCNNLFLFIILLTLGAHVQRGLQGGALCVCVFVYVCLHAIRTITSKTKDTIVLRIKFVAKIEGCFCLV